MSAYNDAEARRARFVELVEAGAAIADASARVGVQPETYRKWRERFPDFKTRVDQAKQTAAAAADSDRKGWGGDFVSFRKEFLGYDTYWHQLKIVDALEHTPPMGISMVLCPPEHGKTSVFEDYITYRICLDPNVRIVVISQREGHAKKIIGRVKNRLYPGPGIETALTTRFGPFYVQGQEKQGKPWAAQCFTVAGADNDERDYTLECRGADGAIQGTRCDLMVIDDIQGRKNRNQTLDLVETFRQDMVTRPGTTGSIVIAGTRVATKDFYSVLVDVVDEDGDGMIDQLVRLPALGHVLASGAVVADEGGDPLCPEMWPKDKLLKRRLQVGPAAWSRNYQQRPQDAETITFPRAETERCRNQMVKLWEDRLQSAGQPYALSILGLDPAVVGGNALVGLDYNQGRKRVTGLDFRTNLATTERILERVDFMATRLKPQLLVVEVNAYQKSLAGDRRMGELARRHGFRIVPHATGVNKLDADLGVPGMATDFRAELIDLPWGDPASRDLGELLVAQLADWVPGRKGTKLVHDLVMALWFAWLWAENYQRILTRQAGSTGGHGAPIRRQGVPGGAIAPRIGGRR